MSSKEEKLLAARKKLREFQGKSKTAASVSPKSVDVSHESETPETSIKTSYDNDTSRSESPFYSSRLAWERRKTLPVSEVTPQISRPSSELSDKLTNEQSDDETEIKLLREQLRRQNQAMNIIVEERSNALLALNKMQSDLQHKSEELNDLKARHLEASQRILDLENASRQNFTNSIHISQVEEKLKHSLESSNLALSAYQEQLSEVKAKLNVRASECDQLNAKVKDLENSLSIANIKIKQLTIDEHSTWGVREKELQESNQSLGQKVELLERRLQAAAMEGEQSTHRFQMYADQCNVQQDALRAQIRELSHERTQLQTDLTQLQYEFDQLKLSTAPSSNDVDIGILTGECESLRQQLLAKEAEVESVKIELKESLDGLRNVTNELENSQLTLRRLEASAVSGRADPALLAAMESDKVAASRAVAQNKTLKEQLTELQEAFVRLSNEKLALTEKLSDTEHECVKLRKQSHDHLHEDHQHNHDCEHSGTVEDETNWDIDMYRRIVETLRKDKTELMLRYQALQKGENITGSQVSYGHGHGHSHSHENSDECDSHSDNHDHEDHNNEKLLSELSEQRRIVKQLQLDKEELLKRLGGQAEDPQVQGLLETKLKRTMDDIAALDEEKQRLEHLVLQLQGETETIGEYIALYHKQRLLLKQRALEKDEQLDQLTKDREELKDKLVSLNELVAKLLGSEPRPEINGSVNLEEDTAKRIQDLITEIGNNNVVNSHSVAFEQCSCCSGRRLITV